MRDHSINTIRLKIQPYRESKRIIPRPHPPPARAVRPRPSRFGARVGPSDSSLPPAPPAGGMITLHTPSAQKQNTAAKFARGHSLRSVTLRYERARLLITVRSRVSVRHLSPLRCSPLRKEPPRHALRCSYCRAPQPGRWGPVPPYRPAFVARLALAAPLCVYMINRIFHFRAVYGDPVAGPFPPLHPHRPLG
jgi:hypothetical protein